MNSPISQTQYNIKLNLSSVQDTTRPNQRQPTSHLLQVHHTPQRKYSANGETMGLLELPKNEPGFLRKTLGATNTLEPSRSNRKLDPFLRNTYFALNSPLLTSSKLSPAVQHDNRQRSQQKSKSFLARKQEPQEKESGQNGGSHYNKIMEKIDKKQKLIEELKKLSSFKISEQIKPMTHEVDTLKGRKGHETNAERLIGTHNSPSFLHSHTSINKKEELHKSAVKEDPKNTGSFTYLKEKIPQDVTMPEEKEHDYKIVIKNPEDEKKSRVPTFIPKSNKASTETKIQNIFTPKVNTTKEFSNSYLASSQVKIPERSSSNTNNYHQLPSPVPKLTYKASMQETRTTMTEVKQIVQKRSRTNSFAEKKLSINDFFLGKALGEGKFGTVYQAVHKETNWLVALKKITKKSITSNYMIDQFLMQVKIQTFCNHENILKLYGCFDDKQHIYLILEYMEEGTLFGVLKKNKTLSEEKAAEKLRQVAEAVNYLHDIGIAHRDIKPENIVISNGVGKLCDLGWAAVCNDRRKTYCGTFDYAAPEILEGQAYDMSVDLWCLGVLAFELLAGKAPFYHISRKETMKRIMNVESTAITYPETMSQNAKSFIENLIKRKPEERMTAQCVLKHPFLAK